VKPNQAFQRTDSPRFARLAAAERRRWPSMKNIAAAVVLTLAASSAFADPPPPGWSLVPAGELRDPARAASPSRYTEAVADFNGDGVNDKALVLKTTRYKGEGVLAYMSEGGGAFHWINVSETHWGREHPDGPPTMGIDVAPPGDHPYMCVERHRNGKCEDEGGGAKRYKTVVPCISYFKVGSAASLFCWDKEKEYFVRVWVSD